MTDVKNTYELSIHTCIPKDRNFIRVKCAKWSGCGTWPLGAVKKCMVDLIMTKFSWNQILYSGPLLYCCSPFTVSLFKHFFFCILYFSLILLNFFFTVHCVLRPDWLISFVACLPNAFCYQTRRHRSSNADLIFILQLISHVLIFESLKKRKKCESVHVCMRKT